MGYSLSVPCKSAKARDQLAEFLRAYLRPFTTVCGEAEDIRAEFDAFREATRKRPGAPPLVWELPTQYDSYDPTKDVWVGHELAYGAGSSKIGFNFSTQGQFSIYMHTVLSWAALLVGRRRGLNDLAVIGHADQRVAYISYDSHPIPVLLPSDMADWTPEAVEHGRDHWQVDGLGLRYFGDTAHYAEVELSGNPSSCGQAPLVVALWTRDKALRAITAREMTRLDELWG